jgi:hypothetical protein
MLVTVITPSNAAIFPEYIIPNIKYLTQDPEVSVRCTYAQCIVQLADTAVRYLEMGQALKAHGTFKLTPDAQEYDQAHFEVRTIITFIFVTHVCILIGVLRCKYARAAEQYTGTPFSAAHGSVQRCETGCAARHLFIMYIPRQAKDERCLAEPYDHLLERP